MAEDKEVLAGEAVSAIEARAKQRLLKAKTEAGRRRLENGRAGAGPATGVAVSGINSSVSIAEARCYVDQAVRDSRYTLAARQLSDMSEEDVLRLYQHLKELESDDSIADS